MAREAPNLGYESLVIPVLTNIVDHNTSIEALQPCSGRPVVEQAGVPTVVSKRTAAVCTLEAAAELTYRGYALTGWHAHRWGQQLNIHVGHVGFIPRCGKGSPIAMTKSRGIEYFNYFEVPCAQNFDAKVLERRKYQSDRRTNPIGALEFGHTQGLSSSRIRRDMLRGLDESIRFQSCGITAKIDMDVIC